MRAGLSDHASSRNQLVGNHAGPLSVSTIGAGLDSHIDRVDNGRQRERATKARVVPATAITEPGVEVGIVGSERALVHPRVSSVREDCAVGRRSHVENAVIQVDRVIHLAAARPHAEGTSLTSCSAPSRDQIREPIAATDRVVDHVRPATTAHAALPGCASGEVAVLHPGVRSVPPAEAPSVPVALAVQARILANLAQVFPVKDDSPGAAPCKESLARLVTRRSQSHLARCSKIARAYPVVGAAAVLERAMIDSDCSGAATKERAARPVVGAR